MNEWIRVAAADDCPPGSVIERLAGEQIVAIANIAGVWHAVDGLCSHQGGPLGKGTLSGGKLICPWHGWEYDVKTGRHCTAANVRQNCFEVEHRGGELFVRLRAPLNPSAE